MRWQLIDLRRPTAHDTMSLLGHMGPVAPLWPHRLVRCAVDVDAGPVGFYALRRREPHQQPLVRASVGAAAFGSRTRPVRAVRPPDLGGTQPGETGWAA
jgi:hypothetical protein